ncbi:PKD domain-containing protein, partial [Psychroserpens sp. XS_ASV72]|uniref:PKD domain-containing protein n=1 Tax=Psychroserpens sp. XS_ASV72 TaxID=3241293 RepID=UPI0035148629
DDVTDPATPTLSTVTGECSATASVPTTTDNCSGTITGTTSDPLTYNAQGTYTITWTFDDGNGNAISVPQTVIVDDVTDPATPTLSTVTDECSATASVPTTTDNCSGTVTGTTSDPLTYNAQGTYTITWTFDDGNGNAISVPQTVIVDDVTDPATPTLSTVTGECSATASVPTTTDNCSGTITGTTSDPLTYNAQGTYTITWTFDDGNGNAISVPQTVIVDDVTDPATPTLSTVTGECSATASVPTTTDNCSGTIMGTTSDPLTYNAQGTYTITWTFDDGNGNVISVPQTVIVDDVTDPATPTLSTVTGECSATASVPTTTDNCSGTITGTTSDPLTYNAQGTYTINWTFDDG